MASSNSKHSLEPLGFPKFKNWDLNILNIQSEVLKKNPLKDSAFRSNPVLSPRNWNHHKFGVVFVLSGFAGNGPKALADKGFDQNLTQQLDRLVSQQKAPLAHYVFVDAWTFWGGSQFINSSAMGAYEDYLVKELYPKSLEALNASPHKICVMGQSSGGYGALHLASKFPHYFPFCGALSPDCFFEASLLPDFYKTAPFFNKNKNYASLKRAHQGGEILKAKNGFSVLNCIAMTACYSASMKGTELHWPIDFQTGEKNQLIWKNFLAKDPVHFLPKRKTNLQKLKGLYLDVGSRDEFHLQLGVRQIRNFLQREGLSHHSSEFEGGHFDSQPRFAEFWSWLFKRWNNH